MRMSNYPRTPTLTDDSVFITDSQENGTKGIRAKFLASELFGFLNQDSLYAWCDAIELPVWDRRRLFRGKHLGNEVTPLQRARIRNGTFEDLFIGDHWTIDNIDCVILDFDYYMDATESQSNLTLDDSIVTQTTPVQKHHITLEARNHPFYTKYDDYSTIDGGYANSFVKQKIEDYFNPLFETLFEGYIQPVCLPLSNYVTSSGEITSVRYTQVKAVLPTTKMLFGSNMGSSLEVDVAETKTLSYYALLGYSTIGGIWLRDYDATIGLPLCVENNRVTSSDPTFTRAIYPIFNIQYGAQGG